MPEKFSGLPWARVCPHLAETTGLDWQTGNPQQGGQRAETGQQKTGQWGNNKTCKATAPGCAIKPHLVCICLAQASKMLATFLLINQSVECHT